MKKLTETPILLTGVISMAMAVVFCLAAVFIYMSPEARVNRQISCINEYLNAGNLAKAVEEGEKLKPAAAEGDRHALQSLMQLSYESGDIPGLKEYYAAWLKAGQYTSEAADMQKVIDSIDEYNDRTALNGLLSDGYFEKAEEFAAGFYEKYRTEDIQDLRQDLLTVQAENYWMQGKNGAALDCLDKAEELVPGDERFRNELFKVSETAVKEMIAEHNYEDAEALIDRCNDSFGRDVLEEYRDQIEKMQSYDGWLIECMAGLKKALKDNDNEKLIELMSETTFKGAVRNLRKGLFEPSPGGKGKRTAVYNVNGKAYLYYGSIKDGKREGVADWIFVDDNGDLYSYKLSFEDDKPQGQGSCSHNSVVTVFNNKAKITESYDIVVNEEFSVKNGVMDGKYVINGYRFSEHPFEFCFEQTITDGYLPAVDEEDYPEGIDKYMEHPLPVAGWSETEIYDTYWRADYKSTLWFDQSMERRCVEGINAVKADAAVRERSLYSESEEETVVPYVGSGGFYATANPKPRPVAQAVNTAANSTPSYIPDVLNPIPRATYPSAASVLDSVGWDLKAAYFWSVNTLTYYGHGKPDMPENGSPGTVWFADFGFTNHKGNCFVFAATFCEMARLLGYPCRQMYGQVPAARGGLTPHSWTEVNINGRTYVFDPEFQHATGKNGFMIGYGTPGTWRYTSYSPMSD